MLSHDPASVDYQSSFIEKWWLLTGVRLCNEWNYIVLMYV